ncbi:MAG TPA: flagellar basal body rod C-terminal domain-containing protein [Terriglobales bacterium]|nr:flagellar basal body rod C-terminal domain-containing protein [Terriglobales bacterium]
MDLSAIALQGLRQAEVNLDKAATRIASFGADSANGDADSVDLSAEMVALMSAKNHFSLNLQTLETANEVQQSVIDILA